MFKRNIVLFCILLMIGCLASNSIFAQQPLTQEEFAVQLVENMELQDMLPAAALSNDCVSLLESLGISPLEGWNRNARLTEEDYTVIIAKAVGKEGVVHTKAAGICQRNINLINSRWQKKPNLSFEQFLKDENIFPNGAPQCPYGLKYKSQNRRVKTHYHPKALFAR